VRPGFAAWLKFNAVGIIGVGVQLSALAIFRDLLGWGLRLATFAAVECAVLHNFIWHERWTWSHRKLSKKRILVRLLKFNFSNGLISIVGNLAVMELLAVRLHFNYMVSNLAAIGVCSLVNFLVSHKVVFK
jgi:putative flippase GtrA